jgi:hypothetical protein
MGECDGAYGARTALQYEGLGAERWVCSMNPADVAVSVVRVVQGMVLSSVVVCWMR